MTDPNRIVSEEDLRTILPEPNPMMQQKVFDHVDSFAEAFIARTTLIMLATTGADGSLDVSPKGDAAGFVYVEDPKTLWIPERPGNKLAYGFRNMLVNPRVGLIFVVPGVKETLRINGSVEIRRDPEVLEKLSARNKPALLATRVHVEESFFHCGKALIRSNLWKPESWPKGVKANIGAQLANRMDAGEDIATRIDDAMTESYETELY